MRKTDKRRLLSLLLGLALLLCACGKTQTPVGTPDPEVLLQIIRNLYRNLPGLSLTKFHMKSMGQRNDRKLLEIILPINQVDGRLRCAVLFLCPDRDSRRQKKRRTSGKKM